MIHVAVLSYNKQPTHEDLPIFGLYVEEFAGKTVEIKDCLQAEQAFNTGLKVSVFRLTTEDDLTSDTLTVVVLDSQATVKTMLADISAYIEGLCENVEAEPGPLFSEEKISWCYLRGSKLGIYDHVFNKAEGATPAATTPDHPVH